MNSFEIYQGENLDVSVVSLEYLLGMKLSSGRDQDIDDLADGIRLLGIKDPEELEQILTPYGFEYADEDLVLEAFGRAYGLEWLPNAP